MADRGTLSSGVPACLDFRTNTCGRPHCSTRARQIFARVPAAVLRTWGRLMGIVWAGPRTGREGPLRGDSVRLRRRAEPRPERVSSGAESRRPPAPDPPTVPLTKTPKKRHFRPSLNGRRFMGGRHRRWGPNSEPAVTRNRPEVVRFGFCCRHSRNSDDRLLCRASRAVANKLQTST